jgi:hypothetical protein
MISLLYDFVNQCNERDVTPDDRHVKGFLKVVNREDLAEQFIKFCFYHWEDRMHMIQQIEKLNIKLK